MESILAARLFRAGVVECRDARAVRKWLDDDRVVRDRRADDGSDALIDEFDEGPLHCMRRTAWQRQPEPHCVHDLDLVVEARRVDDLLQAEAQISFERTAVVGGREVVQDTDAHQRSAHLRAYPISPSCCICVRLSPMPHRSTAWPSAKRRIPIARTSTARPVGGTPISSPSWIPVRRT